MNKEKNEDAWVICPVCETKLKKENIETHLKHVHDKKIEDFDESSIKVLSKKGKKQKKTMNFSFGTIAIIIVIMIVIVAAAFFILSGSSDEPNNNGEGGNSDNPDWLDDYTPVHSLGTGSDKFWINFPSGQSPDHLTWITESLEEKPVFFVCHRTGCYGCSAQADRVIALGEKYSEDAIFYDLDYPYSQYGTSPEDILNKFYEAFYYDPNGGSNVIATTGVFTIINDDGEEKIAWHSWEGNVDDAEMESWVKDIIYYYNINK